MMNDDNNFTNQPPRSNRTILFIVIVVGLIVSVATAVAGFAIGRATVSERTITETVTELLEVTREVNVTREVEVTVVVDGSEIGDSQTNGQETEDSASEESSSDSQNIEAAPRLENVDEIDFDLFFEAWGLVEEQFDGEIPLNEEILFSAIEGSLDTLGDENTRFIRPDVAARLRENAGGAVEGIGAFVRETDDGLFEIVRPIAGQPAEAAGLLPGDIVVAVDGQSVADVTFDEVILLVRGPRGTDVTLTISREGVEEPIDFTITRVRFELATVEFEMLEGNIGYIKLATFLDPTATEKVAEALQTLLDQGAESVIFDVRDDPGGFLNQALTVADLFLPDSVVMFERNSAGLDRVFRAEDGDLGEDVPLVVLINGGSASASEIVAGAIQDNGRGILIGELTFGKGSVQNVFELSDGSEMRVTIARFYSPNNNVIHGVGVTPDIIVEMEFDAEEDIQLLRAIEYLQNGE
jgi:carboxyl-terminal processing protease